MGQLGPGLQTFFIMVTIHELSLREPHQCLPTLCLCPLLLCHSVAL